MSLIGKKYSALAPIADYLLDDVVLAHAWKKAHQYIRSTNWYADTFELDRSAINLDDLIEEWKGQMETKKFKFDPLRIVPAPKAQRWHFSKVKEAENLEELLDTAVQRKFSHVWQPNTSITKPLRPLAHVTIRDQTIFMALMMCLANKVETLQGDTSTSFDIVHETKVVSYGNRLFCNFIDKKAFFPWGNSTSYSKFFSDYQRFLARPIFFGSAALQQKIKNESVFEIHFDIAKFYDNIQRTKLVEALLELCESKDDIILNRILSSLEKWKWDGDSERIYQEVCAIADEQIPNGIPQGLVAGGFLANIYLLDFDKKMHSLIGQPFQEGIRIIDYCRYVDDMRIILIAPNQLSTQKIKVLIGDVVEALLGSIGLKFNPDKTKIERFRYKRAGISQKLNDIQTKVSGPMSPGEIDEQLGHLEGLMSLADSLRLSEVDSENNNPLADIEMPVNDVRDDTLLRFSANKITALLKQKRSFYSHEVDSQGIAKPGSWDFLQERMARKFIAAWSNDPSLVLLLKKGLELFPDKKILKPVVEQLREVLDREAEPKQIKIAQYCLGEIFRHSAIAIYIKDRAQFPAHADVDSFFEILQAYAVEVIVND
jgi:hypothetical protein